MYDADSRTGNRSGSKVFQGFRLTRAWLNCGRGITLATLAAAVSLACETQAALAYGSAKEFKQPVQVYGGDAKDAQKLKSIGVGLRMAMKFSVSVAQRSELNRTVALALKGYEDRLNACYMQGIEGDVYTPGNVTTLGFRFTLDERASRIVTLTRAPGEKGNTALAMCIGRVIRRLLVPVPRDVQVALKVQFVHKYEHSVASN